MVFKNVFDGIEDCNCVENSLIDVENIFVRRIFNSAPAVSDFLSYHELKKKPKDNCKDKCGYRGVSINLIKDRTLQLKKYRDTIIARKKFNPEIKIPEYGLIFKFTGTEGKIKQTGQDPTHHDFYKEDSFTLSLLNTTEIIYLPNV